jgi:signal transduction histidine kinase/ligand-binding sensor domain-containing protein
MAYAARQNLSVSELQRSTWTEKDGVPEKTWVITKTTDGWMWFGGPSGLYRFDGIRFEKVSVDSKDANGPLAITDLHALKSGELLIGMNQGGVSSLMRGKYTRFDGADMYRAGEIHTFCAEDTGVVWATASNGLLRFDGHRWEFVGPDWGYPGGGALGITIDRDKTLWVATPTEIVRLQAGSHKFELTGIKVDAYSDLIQSADARIWIANPSGIRPLPGAGEVPRQVLPSLLPESTGVFFDSEGYLWSTVPNMLSTWKEKAVIDMELLGKDLTTGFADRDGSVWFGTYAGRVIRLRRPVVKIVAIAASRAFVTLVSDNAGKVWAGLSWGFDPAVNGVWTFDGAPRHVQADEITSVTSVGRDRAGAIWVGGPGGIWRQQHGRFERAVDLPPAARGVLIRGLTPDCAGGLWVLADGFGLFQHDGTQWIANGKVLGLPNEAPNAQACDSSGRLWLGYKSGVVARVDHGQARMLGPENGLKVGPITALGLGAAHTLVAGERGLAVLRGDRFDMLATTNPSALEQVTGIGEAANGDVWLSGGKGLSRIDVRDIESLGAPGTSATLPVERFDESDGFPGAGYSRILSPPTMTITPDGKVWVAGAAGIGWIDSNALPQRDIPAPVLIRSLVAEGVRHDALEGPRLPKGTRSIEIDYTALNYSHPDRLRFRYRLEGVDDDWVMADMRRQAFYSNLGPGEYRFVVNVSDERGAWTTSSGTLNFDIAPTFMQSRLFKVLCTSLALALITVAYTLRIRHLERRQLRLLEERLAERERIARELHDTLLQGTQALILDVHRAATLFRRGELSHEVLEDAMTRAEGVMAEGRGRIQLLRGGSRPIVDIARSLSVLGEEQSLGSTIEFRAIIEGSPKALVPRVALEAHHIGREAILNAFRHAQASSIELRLVYSRIDFRLLLSDDGRGIAPHILGVGARPGHWGIPGMRERASAIGAMLEIAGLPRGGTRIELRIPAASAYLYPNARTRGLMNLLRTVRREG